MSLDFGILFRKRSLIDGSPGLVGQQIIPLMLSARRNAGEGSLSGILTRALVAALAGQIHEVSVSARGVHLRFASTTRPGTNSQAGLVHDAPLQYVSRTFDDPANKLTYHVGLIALGEALAQPTAAVDLLQAYLGLLEAGGGRAHTPANWDASQTYKDRFLTAADELYYWLRYVGDQVASAGDRWATGRAELSDNTGLLAPIGSGPGVQNLAHLFTDAAALRAHLDRATAGPGVVSPPAAMLAGASPAPLAPPVVVAPPVVAPPGGGAASLFKGWQYPVVVEALGRGRHLLFVGPTGSGKTCCFQEAVRLTNQPCELVEGYEGLEDLDFVGAIVPQPPRLEEVGGNLVVIPESKCWVDGPVARAMRRALIEQRRVYLFVDELNRIQTRKLAVLTGLLNPIPAAVLRAAGGAPAVDAAEYYVLPIHLTGERIAVPVDWFAVAGACNMGRQYAVNDLDPALLSRLTLKLEFAYLGEADEVALVVERTGRPLAMAQVMVRTAAETRRLCGLGELPGEVDTRVLLDWAREARGADLDALWQAAAITWLAGVAGRDLRGQVLDGNAQAIRDILADRLGVGTTI